MKHSISDRRPAIGTVLAEAARMASSSPVTSTLVSFVVAATCAAILATTGQTVRAEQEVLARIDEAGTRLVAVFDDQGQAGIEPDAVERIQHLSRVEWAIGFGPASDGHNPTFGRAAPPVATRTFQGALPGLVTLNGRPPLNGEGLIGIDAQASVGLTMPVGVVDVGDWQISIVGGFLAAEPLAFLNSSVLVRPLDYPDNAQPVRSIYVLADRPSDVSSVTRAVGLVLGADDPTQVRYETSQALADVRAAVAGELGRFNRELVVGVLGIGLLLVFLIVYSAVTLKRPDFGRRRALGASRGTITVLVAAQTAMVAIAGALLGTGIGLVIVNQLTNGLPAARFVAATGILAVLSGVTGSLPPAVIAARRDPVQVLRIP